MVLQGFGYILDSIPAQIGLLLVLVALFAPCLAFLDLHDRVYMIEHPESAEGPQKGTRRRPSFLALFLGLDPILLIVVYPLLSPLIFAAYVISPIYHWSTAIKTWPLLRKQAIIWGAILSIFVLGIALIILAARPI